MNIGINSAFSANTSTVTNYNIIQRRNGDKCIEYGNVITVKITSLVIKIHVYVKNIV
jgi:hypothetical protein